MTEKASSIQIAGNHYRKLAIQPSEFCQRNGLGWCEANVVKYVSRWREKNGGQDIDKAIHYLQLLKEWEFPPQIERVVDATMPVSPTPLSLCAICAKADKSCPIYPQETQHCAEFRDKVEREALDLTLPSITQDGDLSDVLAKHHEEHKEWDVAPFGSLARLIEAWDCHQTVQTYVERGGNEDDLPYTMAYWISVQFEAGHPVMQAKRIMEIKNAARGKYSDADCARILADV